MSDKLKKYFEYLTGGFELDKLHVVYDENDEMKIVMFMMDAECDPYHVIFDPDGFVVFRHDLGDKYQAFESGQLRFIAKMADKADRMWRKHWEKNAVD
ncbi:MAG: hypothetical protein H5U19_08260 [Rhodobacteraceae bacterium]|nr:hypothetical protein [Paracoccaceae bacterium]